jgi:nitrate/nitrite-specific signal transduction histidine kinase
VTFPLDLRAAGRPVAFGSEFAARAEQVRVLLEAQRAETLRRFLLRAGTALGIMVVASVALGWLVAGRPLRVITAAARRISASDLHQRLALDGRRDELSELGDTLDGLLTRLDAAFAAQRQFVANPHTSCGPPSPGSGPCSRWRSPIQS